MQLWRDAADGMRRLLARVGAAVWLVLAVAAVDAAAAIEAPSRSWPVRHGSSAAECRVDGTVHRAVRRVPPAGAARVSRWHVGWRPRLHRTISPWMNAASRARRVHAPADAIVDPFAGRWLLDAVPPAREPHVATLGGRPLRLYAVHETPGRAPYLVRSFPRPPPGPL
jgi:hypothetical protein